MSIMQKLEKEGKLEDLKMSIQTDGTILCVYPWLFEDEAAQLDAELKEYAEAAIGMFLRDVETARLPNFNVHVISLQSNIKDVGGGTNKK